MLEDAQAKQNSTLARSQLAAVGVVEMRNGGRGTGTGGGGDLTKEQDTR